MSFLSPKIERCAALVLALALASSPGALARTSGRGGAPAGSASPDHAKGLSVLHAFQGLLDGATPTGGVTVDASGVIFGTTSARGMYGLGTMFEIERTRKQYTQTTIYQFPGIPDGSVPSGSVLEDTNGNLFTTTQGGGSGDYGTALELRPAGGGYAETERFSFNQTDGAYPVDGFVASGTVLYATTFAGGKFGYGAIVAVTLPDFKERSVYDFTGGADGSTPLSGLVQDAGGALYGTTIYGGSANHGVVFKFVPSGRNGKETVLWTFDASDQSDGMEPAGSALLDGSGNIYGATQAGGANGKGTVFKLTPGSGGYAESILHSFGGSTDGVGPSSGLTARGGLLYGVTLSGGTGNDGTIFEISPTGGHYEMLYSFAGSDGAHPASNLYASGNALYGEAQDGGTGEFGVVFRFVP